MFTYEDGGTSVRNRVRLLIGDTTEAEALFSDAELDDMVTRETSVDATAALACETLAIRFARQFDFSADGSSFHASQKSAAYKILGRQFRARARGTTVVMPQRVDGYSQTIPSDQATQINLAPTDELSGRDSW